MNKVLSSSIISLIISYSVYAADSFKENEVHNIYKRSQRNGNISRYEAEQIVYAARNPYAPTNSHAGDKFIEALAWYNDVLIGNNDSRFSLRELSTAFEQQLEKYLTILFEEGSASERMSAWKMLQKLKILEKTIIKSGKSYYYYRSKELSQVSYKNEWNKRNTIFSEADFNERVLDASWIKPVLVKFGLTYCVHCLLMENLGSVPAVARRYRGKMNVYKLWWNPKNPSQFYELNMIATEQGVSSSPVFNLYIDGRLIKSEYAFPDEHGLGLEEFLHGVF